MIFISTVEAARTEDGGRVGFEVAEVIATQSFVVGSIIDPGGLELDRERPGERLFIERQCCIQFCGLFGLIAGGGIVFVAAPAVLVAWASSHSSNAVITV